MFILGIESTCDETSVAIVEDGKKILSNIVASSALMHQKYGGIVPEVAAREQIKVIIPTIDECLKESGLAPKDVEAIAVAYGPGLLGSLLIGTETARTLALSWNKPLIGVNHLVGHIYANWLERKVGNTPKFPLIALVVSGGHTDLILMPKQGKFKWLGGTRDDSAGEAFDKVARVLGLKYPGGPEIERCARQLGIAKRKQLIRLPRPMAGSDDFDFSFAGIKTAVVNLVNKGKDIAKESIAYEFQEAVCDVLVKKTLAAANKFNAKSIIVGGGVSANIRLRERMNKAGEENSVEVFFPDKALSVDNGAMIAAAAYYEKNLVDPLTLRADPGLHFD